MLEDDPTGSSATRATAPPTLFELEGGEHVIYSLVVLEDDRARGARRLLRPAQALDAELETLAVSTYITPVLLGQATVFEFLRRGNFEPNLERVCDLLRARRDAMLEALERSCRTPRWSRPQGGYFVWLELPGGTTRRCSSRAAAGVTFVPGSDFGGAPNDRSARVQLRVAGRD